MFALKRGGHFMCKCNICKMRGRNLRMRFYHKLNVQAFLVISISEPVADEVYLHSSDICLGFYLGTSF
jgi:hypothetical protein